MNKLVEYVSHICLFLFFYFGVYPLPVIISHNLFNQVVSTLKIKHNFISWVQISGFFLK